MSEQSSRLPRIVAIGAAAGALAIAGIAATGCGSDDESKSVNDAIDSIQSQASSVQSSVNSQVSTALDEAQERAKSVQEQAKSIQEDLGTQTSTNGGSGVPGY
jgi:hypothetical protein